MMTLALVVGQAIVVGIEHKPRAPTDVVDAKIVAPSSEEGGSTGFDLLPQRVRALQYDSEAGLSIRWWHTSRRPILGRPPRRPCQPRRIPRGVARVVVRTHGRVDVHEPIAVAKHRAHAVVRVDHVHVETVGRQTGVTASYATTVMPYTSRRAKSASIVFRRSGVVVACHRIRQPSLPLCHKRHCRSSLLGNPRRRRPQHQAGCRRNRNRPSASCRSRS